MTLERQQPVAPKVESTENTNVYARFVIEPLERGFGTTLGNALRRVLLSSLPGAAITSIKIEGIQHEYTTIPHMKEDVMEFRLNVKSIRLRPLSGRPGRLRLEVSGPGRVCAGDIQPSVDFEIVNPELHLATLDSPEAGLSVEFNVEHGMGYVPGEHSDGLPLGTLPVDAVFTPIRKVNYAVGRTRVGHVTDYDSLTLEVWTDGTIRPSEAVRNGSQILIDRLLLFTQMDSQRGRQIGVGGRPAASAPSQELYKVPLEKLGLSSRTFNALRRNGYSTVGEVAEKTTEELKQLRHFGEKSLQELTQKLAEVGVTLQGHSPSVEEPRPHPMQALASLQEPANPEETEKTDS